MNVLILTKENNQGGLVTHVINLANTLKEQGHHVVAAGPPADGRPGRFKKLRCEYVPMDFSAKNPRKAAANLKKLCRIIQKRKIDIVHSHNRITSVYAKLACQKENIPFVWTLHLNQIPSGFLHRQFTFYGSRAIVVGAELIPFCVEKLRIPQKDTVLVYNGVYAQDYPVYDVKRKKELRRKWQIQPQDKVIVVLSRLDPVKGHWKVVEAVRRLKEKQRKDGTETALKVLFTGESMVKGYKRKLKEKIKQYGMERQFVFTGYVKPADILNISDLFVLPSDNEGFSISMIEAFLLHVPVIRTKTGGFADVKEFCYPMKNDKDLAVFLDRFLKGGIDVSVRVQKAYRFAMENGTCNVMAQRVAEVYQEILQK